MPIHLQNPQFMKGLDVFARASGDITGAQIAISVPDRGRFFFSTQPEPGFRMEAVVEGSRLEFIAGSDMFDVHCSAPVIEGGAYYLWVKREPVSGRTTLPNLDLSIH
jgi:hypothetical protein